MMTNYQQTPVMFSNTKGKIKGSRVIKRVRIRTLKVTILSTFIQLTTKIIPQIQTSYNRAQKIEIKCKERCKNLG